MEQKDGLSWHKNLKSSSEQEQGLANNVVRGKCGRFELATLSERKNLEIIFVLFRWHNHLDPNINKDPINREEEK